MIGRMDSRYPLSDVESRSGMGGDFNNFCAYCLLVSIAFLVYIHDGGMYSCAFGGEIENVFRLDSTHRHTDKPRYISRNRPHLASGAVQLKNNENLARNNKRA